MGLRHHAHSVGPRAPNATALICATVFAPVRSILARQPVMLPGMTYAEIDRHLDSLAIRYDGDEELLYDGSRRRQGPKHRTRLNAPRGSTHQDVIDHFPWDLSRAKCPSLRPHSFR